MAKSTSKSKPQPNVLHEASVRRMLANWQPKPKKPIKKAVKKAVRR